MLEGKIQPLEDWVEPLFKDSFEIQLWLELLIYKLLNQARANHGLVAIRGPFSFLICGENDFNIKQVVKTLHLIQISVFWESFQ